MRIGYSKMDSDVIAKMKGTFQERPKKAAADKGGKKSKKGVKVKQVNFFVFRLTLLFLSVLGISIGFNVDPDPAFYPNLDPDPDLGGGGGATNADPDPSQIFFK
jgi:hypothetical protein